jgi:hypothetical protein
MFSKISEMQEIAVMMPTDSIPVSATLEDTVGSGREFNRFIARWVIFNRYEFRKAYLTSRMYDIAIGAEDILPKRIREEALQHWEQFDLMLKSPFGVCCQDANELAERIKSAPNNPDCKYFARIRELFWKIRVIWHCRKQIIGFVFAIKDRS